MLEFFKIEWSSFSRIKELENDRLFLRHACRVYLCYDNWDDFDARILIVLWVYGRIFDLIDLGWEKY